MNQRGSTMRAHDKILVAAGFIALFMTAGFVGVYFDTDFLLSHLETSVSFMYPS